MDVHKMIAELQAERQRLDDAIHALERLSMTQKARYGSSARSAKNETEAHANLNSENSGEDPAANSVTR